MSEGEPRPTWQPAKWQEELFCLGLVLLAGWPLLAGQCYSVGPDIYRIYLPLLAGVERALESGELFVWSGDAFAGYCALGAGQSGTYYPLNWILLALFPLVWAFKLSYLVHYWLLVRGVMGAVRELEGSWQAALVASSVALLGGTTAAHVGHFNAMAGIGWTGMILWATVCLLRSERPLLPGLALAASCGLILLQGNPAYCWYAVLACGCVAPVVRAPGRSWRRDVGLLAAFGLFGLALALAQVLPVAEYAQLNPRHRPGSAFEYLTGLGVGLADLPRWVQPDLFGTPIHGTWAGDPTHYVETRAFFGTVFLALALARVLLGGKGPLAKAGVVLVVVGLVLVPAGDAWPLWRALVHVPPFALFRYPARYVWLVHLGVALLAAGGADALVRGAVPRRVALYASGGAAAAVLGALALAAFQGHLAHAPVFALILLVSSVPAAAFALLHRAGARLFPAVLALGILELTVVWHGYAATRPDAEIMTPPRLLEPVLASEGGRRIMDVGLPFDEGDTLHTTRLMGAAGATWGASYFTGYESLTPVAQLGVESGFHDALTRGDTDAFVRLCTRYSNRWVLTAARLEHPSLARVAEDRGVFLYEDRAARPLAYAIAPSYVAGDHVSTPADRDVATEPVEVTSRGATRWELRTRSAEPRLVVLAQSFYPGWIATVDGEPATLLTADLLFMAAPVPPGEHTLVFEFDNAMVYLGQRLSLAAWLAWLACLALAISRRRQHTRAAT